MMIATSQQDITSKIIAVKHEYDFVQDIKKLVENNKGGEYVIQDGVLYKFHDGKKLLVVPEWIEKELIRYLHNSGYFPTAKTEEIFKKEPHFPIRVLLEYSTQFND